MVVNIINDTELSVEFSIIYNNMIVNANLSPGESKVIEGVFSKLLLLKDNMYYNASLGFMLINVLNFYFGDLCSAKLLPIHFKYDFYAEKDDKILLSSVLEVNKRELNNWKRLLLGQYALVLLLYSFVCCVLITIVPLIIKLIFAAIMILIFTILIQSIRKKYSQIYSILLNYMKSYE